MENNSSLIFLIKTCEKFNSSIIKKPIGLARAIAGVDSSIKTVRP